MTQVTEHLQHEQVTTLPLIKHADENDKDWLR